MTERLLSVDEKPPENYPWRKLRGPGLAADLYNDEADAISAELDRLYAAAEANQAPGPDWKAKLREQVMAGSGDAQSDGWNSALEWVVLEHIDALPDPPTPDPDAPPVYVPPEGHYIVLGRNVPDGWEGRCVTDGRPCAPADNCRRYPDMLFEVRRVLAPEPATEWVPLHQIIGRRLPSGHGPIGGFNVGIRYSNVNIGANTYRLVTDGEGCVEVLAEGER